MPKPINSFGAAPLTTPGYSDGDQSRRAASSSQPGAPAASHAHPAPGGGNESKRQRARLGLDTSRAGGEAAASPRVRKRHDDSSGSSENGSPTTLFRSLRPDEKPFEEGLLPPSPCDDTVSARLHIEKGSSLKVKSAYVSATRSLKTAAAWAATEESGRVAKFTNPSHDREVYDLTSADDQAAVFAGSKSPGLNFAKGSQEVVIKHGVPPGNIQAVYDARRVPEQTYQDAKTAPPDGMYKQIKSRARVSATVDGKKRATQPVPVQLFGVEDPRRSSGQ